MLPKRDNEDKYLLLPSVFGRSGLFRFCVVDDLLRDGIIEVFIFFTLAERASEDLVGVVAAFGRLESGRSFPDTVRPLSCSVWLSREAGRAAEVSSPYFCLTRLPGDVFSSLSEESLKPKPLRDLDRTRTFSG